MTIETHRCKNCGIKYQYQRSGCFDQECNEIYCGDCSNLINDFLIKSGTKNSIKSNFISMYEGLVTELSIMLHLM